MEARRVILSEAKDPPEARRSFGLRPQDDTQVRQDPPYWTKIRDTFELIRFSHTIFALPFALASMLLAANGLPSLRIFLLIVGCMVLARTSAMAFNRYADAPFDATNPRTQDRHLPSGRLSRKYVLSLTLFSGLAFIGLTYLLNSLAFILSPLALLVVWFYSLTKRFTNYTQLFLGIALGISPIAAWIAVTGTIAWPAILLGLAVTFWVAGFDIFYATQDYQYDQASSLKSLVVKYGLARSLWMARLFHTLTLVSLASLTPFLPNPPIYLITCLIVGLLLGYEHSLVSADDLSRVNKAFFTLNGWVGMIYLVGMAVAIFS